MILEYKNLSNNPNPEYSDNGSSGFDLRVYLERDDSCSFNKFTNQYEYTLKPNEIKVFNTGIYLNLLPYTEAQIRSRSGLSSKHGICVVNSPGTVDESYTGEVKVPLINLSNEEFVIRNGDRVAQCIISPVFNGHLITLNKVDEINKTTERGSGGFGHSGIK